MLETAPGCNVASPRPVIAVTLVAFACYILAQSWRNRAEFWRPPARFGPLRVGRVPLSPPGMTAASRRRLLDGTFRAHAPLRLTRSWRRRRDLACARACGHASPH